MEATNTNSALKKPLNNLLGSRGHIIILREVVDIAYPVSQAELIDRTSLSPQGVYDVVGRLVENGILTFEGTGRQKQVKLRKDHPLAEAIVQLFQTEKRRFQTVVKTLKESITSLDQRPKSVWIYGKVPQGEDTYGDPLQLSVLADVKTVDAMTEQYRNQINDRNLEAEQDVTIEVKGVTGADLAARPELTSGHIILLWGIDPVEYRKEEIADGTSVTTHRDMDYRAQLDAEVWIELLRKYPKIIQRTIQFLDERIPQIPSGERQELQEWKHILESMSFQRLKKFLPSDSERATRLRQSLPFWQVLTEYERSALDELLSKREAE